MSWDYRLDPPDEPELAEGADRCGHCDTEIPVNTGFCSRSCARAFENDGPQEDE